MKKKYEDFLKKLYDQNLIDLEAYKLLIHFGIFKLFNDEKIDDFVLEFMEEQEDVLERFENLGYRTNFINDARKLLNKKLNE